MSTGVYEQLTEPVPQPAEPLEHPGTEQRARRRLKTRLTADSKPDDKATGQGKTTKEAKPIPPYKPGQYLEPLTQAYAMAGMLALPFNTAIGSTITENAEACAKAWDDLAAKNPAVRRALNALLQGSAWSAVIIAHAPIMLVVMHEYAPGFNLGGIVGEDTHAE